MLFSDAAFDPRLLALLACPQCGGSLDPALHCAGCGACYTATDGIPDLRLPGDARTNRVRDFYSVAPFPGYPTNATLEWLRARAARSRFARLLDVAIGGDARIAEVGCGTGQMSLYLATGRRRVIGADLTRESLRLAAAAAQRFGIANVQFVETDLSRPGLRAAAFDVVYCSGVLHHTPDPRAAFRQVARLARPGGIIVIGVYNRIARIPTLARSALARLTRQRWVPCDEILAEREDDPERHEAWLRDQYCHPEEHRHSLGEVRGWMTENDVDYLRSFPSAQLFEEDDDIGLFDAKPDYWGLEAQLAQIGWIWKLGAEGGLFVVVGRRQPFRQAAPR